MNKEDIIYCDIYKINNCRYVIATNIKEAIDIFVRKYDLIINSIETVSTAALIAPKKL